MDKQDQITITKINDLIDRDKDVTIVEEIKRNGNYFSGKIEVDYLNTRTSYDIKIPSTYPLTHPNADNISIIFRNDAYIGLNHINPDGSVCFHPDKDDNFDHKLLYELNCLKQWIRDYFIFDKEDDDYTYIIPDTEIGRLDKLYFTNTNSNFKKNKFGIFDYSIFSSEEYGKKKFPVKKLFRLGFDSGIEDNWSKTFIEELKSKTCKKGLYYFIEEEPIKKDSIGRRALETWDEFKDFFSNEFQEYLYHGLKGKFGDSFFIENSSLFILIGYKIPTHDDYEEHWDLIRIEKIEKPIGHLKIPKSERKSNNKGFETFLKTDKIRWGSTENIDYSRFFGRGKLNEKITDSHILIIGCGALGSSLAEMLVRGGARSIVLEDFDSIRGGNLCRANFTLDDLIFPKAERLERRLKSISPFINLASISLKLNHFNLTEVKEIFNKNVDIIFDCSTDPEVTYILDKIDFTGDVFSFGINNKAKAFTSISGKYLTRQSKIIYDFIGNDEATFIEGTGCGYPTFEANYVDINALLNTGLKIINDNFNKGEKNKTLIIEPRFEDNFKIKIENFENFYCRDFSSSILVSKTVLNQIEEITRLHYPKEFGGVFIGFKNETGFIITDILIPDEYRNGRTKFIREPGNLNDRLKELHKKTAGKIQYIGEWHSHPDGPTSPSTTDLKAMKDIATDKKINVNTPLLMIAGISEILFSKDFYILVDKRLKHYE
ncbi:ThiF family adenylyltransferase [Gillisia sp. M10.2A]|uniref:ThiF family adenylyltransferase n=1 Tax=Gillisia lutea TaxID=2909668 RepID=A0ABS9EFK6_9FLAO|nr:ThiF family adenylyltransferase [Gillisia lutea]MCF4101578.1 ThiF family adenylyltransferase [Gillisia lutea]